MTSHVHSNFADADLALGLKDYRKFSRAICSEMKTNPVGARQIAESSLLKLGSEAADDESPANRMMHKAVDVIITVAPYLSFSLREKALTLRALSVAEAVCAWSIERGFQEKVEAIRDTVEKTPTNAAFFTAVKAGIIDQNGRETRPSVRPVFSFETLEA